MSMEFGTCFWMLWSCFLGAFYKSMNRKQCRGGSFGFHSPSQGRYMVCIWNVVYWQFGTNVFKVMALAMRKVLNFVKPYRVSKDNGQHCVWWMLYSLSVTFSTFLGNCATSSQDCNLVPLKASVVAILCLRGLFKVSEMPGMSSITKNDRLL